MITTAKRQDSRSTILAQPDDLSGQRTQQLMLLCSRRRLDPAEAARAHGLIESGIAWNQLWDQAWHNGLAPLVFHNLRTLDVGGRVPSAVWRQFEEDYYNTLSSNVLLETEMVRVTDRLAAAGIDRLLLKGAVLGELLYPDPALRPSSDIDVMVRHEQLTQAQAILHELGYTIQPGRQLDFQLTRSYDIPFVRAAADGQPVLLELHWHLAEPGLFDLDAATLWARARQMEVHHHPLPTLSLEDLLLHLTIHIRKHRFVGLRWLVDVSELLRGYGEALDWDYLTRTARRAGAGTLFYVTLHLSQELMGAPVPVPVMQSLQPGHVRRWLLRPFMDAQVPMRAVREGSAEWSWLGLGQVLMLGNIRSIGLDLGRRFAPPTTLFPEQASSAGWLADLRFHGQRLVTIALRVVRMAWRRITTGTNRLP